MILSRRHFLLFITGLSILQDGESFNILTRKQVALIQNFRSRPTLYATPTDVMEQISETAAMTANAAANVAANVAANAATTTVAAATNQPVTATATAAAAAQVNPKDIYMQGLAMITDATGGADAQAEVARLASRMAESMAVLDASSAVDVVSAAVAMSTTPSPEVATELSKEVTNKAMEIPTMSNVAQSNVPVVADMDMSNAMPSESLSTTATNVFQSVQVPEPTAAVSVPDASPVSELANTVASAVSQPAASVSAVSVPDASPVSELANTVASVVSQPAASVTESSTLISDSTTSAVSTAVSSVSSVPDPTIIATTTATIPTPPTPVDMIPNLTERMSQVTDSMDQASTKLNDSLSSKLTGFSFNSISDSKTLQTISTPPESTVLSDIASSASSFASETSNKFVEASMKSFQDILDKTGNSVKSSMPELQKALQANTDRILHSIQIAAMSAGDQLQAEATKAVALGAHSVQEGATSALNYVGDRTLIDLGKIVFILVQTIGKLVLYVLNAILDDLQGTTMGDVVEAAKHSVQTMMTDASNYATATVHHIGDMTIAQATQNLVYVITEVAKFTFYVLNSVIEFLTGTSASNWAIAAAHSIEHSANALTAQATSITNDVTHASLSQLTANVGDFSQEVGKVILASSNELTHYVGTHVSALDSVTAAVQLTNF